VSRFKKIKRTISHLFHPQRSNNYRAKLLHPESLLVLSLLAAGLGLAAIYFVPGLSEKMGSVLGYASDIKAPDVIEQTNRQRAVLGLKPLSENRLLDQAAEKKASDMFARQYWAHTAPDGTEPWAFFKAVGYEYRYAGENLARDFSVTPDMIRAWMKSPKHRENIVNPKYTQIGVAVKNGVLNGVETTLVVQLFGTPRNALPELASGEQAKVALVEPNKNVNKQVAGVSEAKSQVVSKQVLAETEDILPEPNLSPLILVKSLLLSIGVMLMAVLVYDLIMIKEKHVLRIVGKNIAHLLFLGTVMFLIFFFKSGSIG